MVVRRHLLHAHDVGQDLRQEPHGTSLRVGALVSGLVVGPVAAVFVGVQGSAGRCGSSDIGGIPGHVSSGVVGVIGVIADGGFSTRGGAGFFTAEFLTPAPPVDRAGTLRVMPLNLVT
ncbi:hypothetical protein GCM10009549_16620 [Streptomyces thermoalcalitolerans]|uniref:Uncharacterized protein n=1 Tax=Streptomyces thermoalcalitolerans TaxID=65605 RepID=A0ABP3YWF8_9ACTN